MDLEPLVQQVKSTLENQGVLASLRAQLRSAVVSVLENSNTQKQTSSHSPQGTFLTR